MAFVRRVSVLEQACIDQDIATVECELLNDRNGAQCFQLQRYGAKWLDGEEEQNIYTHCILNNNLDILRLVGDVYPPKVERLGNSMFPIVQLGRMEMLEWALSHVKRLIDNDPTDFSKRMLRCDVYAKYLLECEPQAIPTLEVVRGIRMLLPFLDYNSVVKTTEYALDTKHIDVARELLQQCTTEDIHRLNPQNINQAMVGLIADVLEERGRSAFRAKLLNEIPDSSLNRKTSKI